MPLIVDIRLVGHGGPDVYGLIALCRETCCAARIAAMPISEAISSTPEAFAAVIRDDIAKWAGVVKATGMKVE